MYNLSKDYPLLYSLLLEGNEVACWVINSSQEKRICSAKIEDGWIWLLAVDITYRQLANEINYFTTYCQSLGLSYIPPTPNLKEIVSKAWDAAEEWNGGYPENKNTFDKETYLKQY